FDLQSEDVIHAFWIPALGGKVDMIPGRTTRLTLEPTKTGTFRGVCAEYCGSSHACMAFDVVVMARQDFERWSEQQRRDGLEPEDNGASRGREILLSRGCGACHAVRGTAADGVIGPDLAHVGSRESLAAGTLKNSVAVFREWVAHNSSTKPD